LVCIAPPRVTSAVVPGGPRCLCPRDTSKDFHPFRRLEAAAVAAKTKFSGGGGSEDEGVLRGGPVLQ